MGKALIIGCGGVASVAIHKCCQTHGIKMRCIKGKTSGHNQNKNHNRAGRCG